jgi:hypothetical protein
MGDSGTTCSYTGRTFASEEAARAGESRFLELQAECDSGRVPELRQGDVIYVDTSIYISHGRDDFRGGLGEVIGFRSDISAGRPTPFVCVAQDPHTWHNWKILAEMQKELRQRHGKEWSHPDPDMRPEFNEW